MATSVLITGATGLVGAHLTALLTLKGYPVSHLGRSVRSTRVPSFVWDVENNKIDGDALDRVDAVIHLAGAGIADKRWTPSRKREILESRTRSTRILYEALKSNVHQVRTFVSASGIGYYGWKGDTVPVAEAGLPGNDFLAGVVKEWEAEVDRIAELGIRVVKLRTGIVLSEKGGALREITRPIKWGAGASLGSGRQVMSWIHVDDLCNMYLKALEDANMTGVYNAVAPGAVTNEEFTKAVAGILGRPLWMPNVPAFLLRVIIGDVSEAVVNGIAVSSEKIEKTGFKFQFPELGSALHNLFMSS